MLSPIWGLLHWLSPLPGMSVSRSLRSWILPVTHVSAQISPQQGLFWWPYQPPINYCSSSEHISQQIVSCVSNWDCFSPLVHKVHETRVHVCLLSSVIRTCLIFRRYSINSCGINGHQFFSSLPSFLKLASFSCHGLTLLHLAPSPLHSTWHYSTKPYLENPAAFSPSSYSWTCWPVCSLWHWWLEPTSQNRSGTCFYRNRYFPEFFAQTCSIRLFFLRDFNHSQCFSQLYYHHYHSSRSFSLLCSKTVSVCLKPNSNWTVPWD